MALFVKKGTFVLSTTDSGTKQIRGVGAQGKAVMLWAGRVGADATWAAHVAPSLGFAVGTGAGNQGSVASFDEDALASASTYRGSDGGRCLYGYRAGTGTVDYRLEFSAWDADGFDLTIVVGSTTDIVIHYVVWGGDDITDVAVAAVDWAAAATYDVILGWQPDFGIIGSGAASGAVNACHAVGFFKDSVERACVLYQANSGAGNMRSSSALKARALAIATIDTGFDMEAEVADKLNWPVDGIRYDLPDQPGAARPGYGLFFKGTFQTKVILFESPTANGNQDLDAGFVPKLSLFFSDDLPAHTNLDAAHADGHGISLGAYDGTTQGLVAHQQDDGNTNSVAKNISDASRVLRLTGPGATPSDLGMAVASYPSGNTVRLAWSGVSGTARQVGAVFMGDAPAGGETTPVSVGASLALTSAVQRNNRRSVLASVAETPSMTKVSTRNRLLAVSESFAPEIEKAVKKFAASVLDMGTEMAFSKTLKQELDSVVTLQASEIHESVQGQQLAALLALDSQMQKLSLFSRPLQTSLALMAGVSRRIEKTVTISLLSNAAMSLGRKFSRQVDASLPLMVEKTHTRSRTKAVAAFLSLSAAQVGVRTAYRSLDTSVALSVSQGRVIAKRFDVLLNEAAALTLSRTIGLSLSSTMPLVANMTILRKLIAAVALPLVAAMNAYVPRPLQNLLLSAIGIRPTILSALEAKSDLLHAADEKPRITEVGNG